MQAKTKGIVLRTFPYKDNFLITHMYTADFGRVAYITRRGRGKANTLVKSLQTPMSVLEIEVEHAPNRELQRIKEARLDLRSVNLAHHPVKNMQASFISEILYKTLREPEPDERLFAYIERGIHILYAIDEGIANYHLAFLMNLTPLLGIAPNLKTYKQGACFDMQSATFETKLLLHSNWLSDEESRVMMSLTKMNFENMSLFALNRQQRNRIVNALLLYYRLHLPNFGDVKSLEVLQSLFS